ncbi:MAG TPA: DUF3108 domain-containing protein [Ramlibacter sp.]|uniref:DUF3108 domain-containing protein n=1 Tax=Ramlibacter sp. TaxID=1917967 RepID=UPI002BD50D0A|nr:DUF3108 domain-containing protein [Ramlibacter sp.]HVZ45536.1 DUF3108 domain-containing protein [Ramlibacter sp.]
MARRHALALVTACVLAAHLAIVDWAGRELTLSDSVLQAMAPPMFTRLLQQKEPPAAAPAPKPKPRPVRRPPPSEGSIAASLPASSASMPRKATATVAQPESVAAPEGLAEPEAVAEPEAAAASEAVAASEADALAGAPASGSTPDASTASARAAEAPLAAASQPQAEASAAAAAASAAPAPSQEAWLDTWPADTRLSYRLDGQFRGPLYGNARVQWQRDGARYQVQLDIDIAPWVRMLVTSQGQVTDDGLVPRAYEEARVGKRRAAQFGEHTIALDGGRTSGKPQGVQDTASQFVDLAHRFATGRDALEVGKSVSFWLARPGSVDLWTYDIVGRETLQTGTLGAVEAYHLKPRPIANPKGNIVAEMWYAPSLQYLPVRIRVTQGSEIWIDLVVDKIEQR